MAKNFVEEGKTVAIVASAAISSGDLVQVGDVFAVALTDIPQGETGDGMTEGVFMLPKLKTDDMKTGKKVYLKSGKVQLTNSGSDPLVGLSGKRLVPGVMSSLSGLTLVVPGEKRGTRAREEKRESRDLRGQRVIQVSVARQDLRGRRAKKAIGVVHDVPLSVCVFPYGLGNCQENGKNGLY